MGFWEKKVWRSELYKSILLFVSGGILYKMKLDSNVRTLM